MDRLAREGIVGMVRTVPDGFSPASDVANMSLLGYPPEEFYSGRAPLEAANIGVSIGKDEVAFRCNLVTVYDGKMVDYSAGHISTYEAEYLIDDLNNAFGPEFRFYTGTSYRHLLIIKTRDPASFLDVVCTPPHNIIGQDIDEYMPRGNEEAASVLVRLMEDSVAVLSASDVNKVRVDLKENPATMIWLWGQGVAKDMPSFRDRYGISGAMISAVDLLKGLGRKVGLEIIDVPGATGYYDTNYKAKADYGVDALKSCDFVMIHLEAPDEAGHNGHLDEKIRAIERFDHIIVARFLKEFEGKEGVRILVSPDHPTPLSIRTHSSEPVGFVIWGEGISSDSASQYSEKACQASGLFLPSGPELFRRFIGR